MKKILLLMAAMPILLAAQTSESSCPRKDGIVVTYDKDGDKTIKDCKEGVFVCPDLVTFYSTKTAWQAFYKLDGGQWVDYATDKIIKTIDKDGIIYFIKSDKKYFGYIK